MMVRRLLRQSQGQCRILLSESFKLSSLRVNCISSEHVCMDVSVLCPKTGGYVRMDVSVLCPKTGPLHPNSSLPVLSCKLGNLRVYIVKKKFVLIKQNHE